MTIRHLLAKGSQILLKSQSASPLLDAEVLISFALGKPKEYLYTYPEKDVKPSTAKDYIEMAKKCAKGMPVAYLTHQKEFFGLTFYVDRSVLIPHLKTELMVFKAATELKNSKNPLRIIDIGTGSACIIIALSKALGPHNKYFASDISDQALKVARRNAIKHKAKIVFKKSDLLNSWQKSFDVVIANLPYLSKQTDISTKYDPKIALISGKQGLSHYERLFMQMQKFPAKVLYIEADPPQKAKLEKMAKKLIPQTKTVIVSDLK